MKVKIIKTSKPTYWYKNKIGEVFEVISGDIFPLTVGERKVFEVEKLTEKYKGKILVCSEYKDRLKS